MGYKYVYFTDENGNTKRELLEINLNEKLGTIYGKILKMLKEKYSYSFDKFSCIRVKVEKIVNDNIPIDFRIGGINIGSFEQTLHKVLEYYQYKFYNEYNVHFDVVNKKESNNGDIDIVTISIDERYQQWLKKNDSNE